MNTGLEKQWRSPRQSSWGRWAIAVVLGILVWAGSISSSEAGNVDSYVKRFLQADEPVAIALDGTGATKTFTAEQLSQGKEAFSNSCLTCHVGGSTLSNPLVSLGMEDLHNATPPRDTVEGLVAYMRYPMFYDSSEANDWCRTISEDWMSDEEISNLAAFILRAAELAPGWGTERFVD